MIHRQTVHKQLGNGSAIAVQCWRNQSQLGKNSASMVKIDRWVGGQVTAHFSDNEICALLFDYVTLAKRN